MKYFIGLLATCLVAGGIFMAGTASAQFDPLDKTCQSTDANIEKNNSQTNEAEPICDASSDPVDPLKGDDSLVVDVVNILAVVAGVAAVVIVIIAGITMMMSAGDSGKVTSSRNAIIYTVIGLIVIILARTIILFVISRVAT